MARKPRIHYENAIYHVIARGNNRENIFLDAGDKDKYLELVGKYKQKYGFEMFAYVLMDNHVHLLVCIDQIPISKIMQGIQQTYTQYYNKKYRHIGHVFQQRYKAFVCNTDAYLLSIVCYIHQNPCRAKLSDGLDYKWSSHTNYMLGQCGNSANPIFVLQMFNDNMAKAVKQYGDLAYQEQKESLISQFIGVEAGERHIIADKSPLPAKQEQPLTFTEKERTFEQIADSIAADRGISIEQFLGKCRVRKVAEARNELIYRIIESKMYSRAELAKKLDVDAAIVTRGYERGKVIQCNLK